MPLAPCRKCGAEISDKATICPKCGCKEPNAQALSSECADCGAILRYDHEGPCPECGNPEPFAAGGSTPEPARPPEAAMGNAGENAKGSDWEDFKADVEEVERANSEAKIKEAYIRSKGYDIIVRGSCPKCWYNGPVGERKNKVLTALRRIALVSGWVFIVSFAILTVRMTSGSPPAGGPISFIGGSSAFVWISARFLLLMPESSFAEKRHFCPSCNFEGDNFRGSF